MPDGRVQRIDHERDCVYIVRKGRSYRAAMSDVEPSARVSSARVHFSLRRIKGEETAEAVQLRTGTRTNRRQRRFADLTGAHSPGSKVHMIANEFGIDVATQPFRVVEAWIEAMGDFDFDRTTALYLPEAVVHTKDGDVAGHHHIRSMLELSPWIGVSIDDVDLRGSDQYVVATTTGSDLLAAFFVVGSGQISEQWVGVEPDQPESEPEPEQFRVVTKGEVPKAAIAYARTKMETAIGHVGEPVLHTEIKLSQTNKPAIDKPAMCEVTLELKTALLRAHGVSFTLFEAIDQTMQRLRSRLEHHSDRYRHDPHGLAAVPGTWRHGNLPSTKQAYFDRASDEREIVRHKSFAPGEMMVEEAAWDLALLDYDFFLYVDLETGIDCVLERDDEGLILHALENGLAPTIPDTADIRSGTRVASILTVSEAVRLLDEGADRFLFFRNQASDRGNVLYRRYDGHYGLITPPLD